jgi:hypothetical protein
MAVYDEASTSPPLLHRNYIYCRSAGIVRYIRRAEDPEAADVAVTIVDDWGAEDSALSC